MDILNDFMANSNEKFNYKIFHQGYYADRIINIQHSGIYVLQSLDDIVKIIEEVYNVAQYNELFLKFFVLVSNLSYEELKFSRIFLKYLEITVETNHAFLHYVYFISNNFDSVILSTVEWFSPRGCNRIAVHRINEFYKDKLKWNTELKSYDKFLNYHGCDLVMMLPAVENDGTNYHTSGYSILKLSNQTGSDSFDIHGITPKVFEIASQYHNFKPDYQPAYVPPNWVEANQRGSVIMIPINNKPKIPNVFFEIKPLFSQSIYLGHSNVIANFDGIVFVTLSARYTPYEKFKLPFDNETWILLGSTFIMTFLSIAIINRFSKTTRNLVYGNDVNSPIWNVISIFFGISQTKLPNKNFSRFILVFFIYFCLIFRTCFQSKFFEFLTSEPRQSPPKTVQDLVVRKYQVYSMEANIELSLGEYRAEQWPIITVINPMQFSKLFLTQSQNASVKLALCVDEFFLIFIENFTQKHYDWNQLKDFTLFTTHEVFIFRNQDFHYPMLKNLINRLIPTGIIKYLIENFHTKKIKFVKDGDEPKVLSLDDLLFGFNIWLICCVISLLAFLIEQTVKYRKKKEPEKLRFAKIHPSSEAKIEARVKIKSELIEKFRINPFHQLFGSVVINDFDDD